MEYLRAQETECLLDLVVVDDTDFPTPRYVEWLRSWARSDPLGRSVRVRLKRFGYDHDGTMFLGVQARRGHAQRLFWEWFRRWHSYDALLSLDCDVLMPPSAVQMLHKIDMPWAAAWLPAEPSGLPLVWHGLTPQRLARPLTHRDVLTLGYQEPPGNRPFRCVVTHLACTLIRREVVEKVSFRLTSAGGAAQLSWDAGAAGFPLHCVPSVRCERASERSTPE